MRFLITGETGFIGRNLRRVLQQRGHDVVDTVWLPLGDVPDAVKDIYAWHFTPGDNRSVPCIYGNTIRMWSEVLQRAQVDVVVHNAAVVGTDVVQLHQQEATLSNVLGTWNICDAAKNAGAKVCFMGTTVVYDTQKYQDTEITEESLENPRTYYGQLKHAGEQIVRSIGCDGSIVRPLFAYGGVGDMNSLVAKTIFSHLTDRKIFDIFLDPEKRKDYLYVDDFCEAVSLVCEKGLWGESFNVAAQTPVSAREVVNTVDLVLGASLGRLPSERVRWHHETDYLGNHVLSSRKVQDASGWFSRTSLREGISKSFQSILEQRGTSYDPMRYLDEAEERGIDLASIFPVTK